MKFGAVINKVITVCQNDENFSSKEEELATPPTMDGLVELQTTHHHNNTFPLDTSRTPHPSHFQTTPAASADNTSPTSPEPESSTSPRPIRRFRRTPTLELDKNPAYHPLGGPEYLKVLAKYDLFGTDEHQGLVVCRFVDAGSSVKRHPQIIKVEEYSAHGNQEFLAHIVIGNPPQSIFPNKSQWLICVCSPESRFRYRFR